jgi:hypothetical protein
MAGKAASQRGLGIDNADPQLAVEEIKWIKQVAPGAR